MRHHAITAPCDSTTEIQITHQQVNMENQIKDRATTALANYKRHKRQTPYDNPTSDTSVQQLKRRRTNTYSSMCSTETKNEGIPINKAYKSS